MTRFVALFARAAAVGGASDSLEASARRLLASTTVGARRVHAHGGAGYALAAVADAADPGPSVAPLARDGDVTVVADATLYYQADLRGALDAAGVRPSGPGAAFLIAAAFRAWGRECLDRLEGDFAFVLHDARTGSVLAARDHAGRRPLAWSELADGTLAVASGTSAILAHPACRRDLDLVAVAEAAVGCVSTASATGFLAVQRLPAAHALGWSTRTAAPPRVSPHWEPPTFESGSARSFEDAAEELRALLTGAVRERLDPTAPTAVWMSGGRDSPAVFAAGQLARCHDARVPQVLPVSMSYPVGDPGHEDGVIQEIATRWGVPVRWLPAYDVPLVDTSHSAGERDGPFAHPFRGAHRMLADASRDVGARVALDGAAGDTLFRASTLHLADLLRRGSWATLAREWRALDLGAPRPRLVFDKLLRPNLPDRLRRGLAPLCSIAPYRLDLRRRVPPWIAPAFAREHQLERFGLPWPDRRRGETLTAHESRMQLTWPFFQRVLEDMVATARNRGVELRSPFLDRRLIAFAATRPLVERRRGGDSKYLLRRAVADALPPSVVETRTVHPGATSGYLVHRVRTDVAPQLERMLDRSVLVDLGIVDPSALRMAIRRIMRTGHVPTAVWLLGTLDAGRWVRDQLDRDDAAASHAGCDALAPAACTAAFVG